jgi:O-antigen/teichoic acid export membrane protein
MKNVTSRIVQVGTPLLAKMNHRGKEFKRKYFLMVQSIAVVVLPIMLLLFLVSKPLVGITFNNGYDLLPLMISYLALLGAVQALVSPVGILYLFREDMQLMTANSLVALLVFAGGLLWSSSTGDIEMVLLVYALSYVVFLMPNSQFWIFRRYGFSLKDFGFAFFPYLAACAVPFALTWLWLKWNSDGHPWWMLFSAGVLFGSTYYVALKLLNRWSEEERLYVSLFKRLGI